MFPDSPIIEIKVDRLGVDTIHVSADRGLECWKLDGFHNGELAAPDQCHEDFRAVIVQLAEYVDGQRIWTDTASGSAISPWQAVVMLTQSEDQGRN